MPQRLFRRLALVGALMLVSAVFASTASAGRYIVLSKQESVASDAAATITSAGGSVIASYPQIGVVIAQSDSASFTSNLLRDSLIRLGAFAAPLSLTLNPAVALYAPSPSFSNGAPQVCNGGTGYNSWYGHGQVDALSAIRDSP